MKNDMILFMKDHPVGGRNSRAYGPERSSSNGGCSFGDKTLSVEVDAAPGPLRVPLYHFEGSVLFEKTTLIHHR